MANSGYVFEADWFDYFTKRGRKLLGLSAKETSRFKDDFSGTTGAELGWTTGLNAVVTQKGGVAVTTGSAALTTNTLIKSNSDWYCAARCKWTTVPPLAGNRFSVGFDDNVDDGMSFGVVHAQSTTKYAARIDKTAGLDSMLSTVDIDANFHNFEMGYVLASNIWYFAVDEEAWVSMTPLNINPNQFIQGVIYASTTAGSVDKYLVITGVP